MPNPVAAEHKRVPPASATMKLHLRVEHALNGGIFVWTQHPYHPRSLGRKMLAPLPEKPISETIRWRIGGCLVERNASGITQERAS